MEPKEQTPRVRPVGRRLLVAGVMLLGLRLRLFGQTGPAWWYNPTLTPSGTAPLISGTANDYGVLNQGELKNLAVTAVNAISNALATTGGTASALNTLAASLSATSALTQDYAIVNLGQLKALAQPFYDFLFSIGYTGPPLISGTYPWITSGNAPSDYAWANIGEAKQLFSFDPTYSTDGTGIPASWVEEYFPGQTIYEDAPLPWSGGMLTYLQAYQQGLNPIDYYNGQTPTLTIISGNNQTGPPGGFVPAPLVVSVTDSNGNALAGAPVIFSVTAGGGEVQASSSGAAGSSLTALTDGNGDAQIFFLLPSILSNTSQVSVTTGTTATAAQVTFSESTDNGAGQFTSPFAPANVMGDLNSHGSVTLTWTNNTDNATPIYVQQQQPNGVWTDISTALPPGTDSYTIQTPSPGPYRISPQTNPASPSANAFIPMPVQSYAAIDVSGTTASNAPGGPYNVSMIALDDSNNVYFGFTAVSGTYPLVSGSPGSYSFLESNNFGLPQGGAYAFKWSNGTATLDGTTALSEFDPTGGTYQFITAEDITTTGMLIGRMESGVYGSASSGTYACAIDEMPFTSDGGEPSALCLPYPYADVDSALALLWAEISTDAYNSGEWEPGYWNCFSRAGAAGYANSYQNINDFLYSSSSGNIIGVEQQLLENLPGTGVLDAQEAPYVMVGGTITVFNPITDFSSVTLPSNLIIDPIYFYVTIINNVGSCVGYDGSGNAAYWPGSGSNLTELAPMEAVAAMNDENQVVGSTGTNGYLWTNPGASSACPLVQSGSSQLISQLIPAPLQNEVADISPIDISGTNANDGSVRILFNAQYLQPPTLSGSSPGWAPGTFLLTLTSGTPSTIFQQVSLPSNVGSTLNSPILNANGLIAEIGNITSGTGSAMTTGTNHALSLVPVQVIVKKQGDPDPAPTMSATNGVLVQNGTTLDIRLSNIPQAQFPIPQNQIVWYSRQLEQAAPTLGDTNTNDYFTAWTALGSQCTGVECTYTPTTSGIFELKATLSYSGTSQDIFYVRQCDATNATDGKGNYPPGLKQGALDYFGVYDAPIQLAIRNSAHSALGSTNYAESVSLTVPTTAPWPFSSFTIGSTPPRNDKCNAFVFVSANAAGATVPLTHTNLLGIHTNPPLAYDWYDSTYTISGWTSLGSSAYPQPGFVISRPDARVLPGGPDAGKRWAHVGILDYDGYWIQAGSKTVNKYPSVTDPAYQPVGMRKYGN